MKRIIKGLVLFIISLIAITLFSKVDAASATISASKTTVTAGEDVTISVKFTAAAWELTASGDGISTAKYVDVTDNAENATTTKTIKLDTSKAGKKTIKLTGNVTDGNGSTAQINTSVAVTVNEKAATGSGNTGTTNKTSEPKKGTLSSCYINGIKVNEYLTVTNKESVPVKITTSTGESATIYNSLTKKSYTVKSGSSVGVQVDEGTNNLTITLESGNKYTRKIYSQKEEAVKPNSIEEEEEVEEIKVLLKSLKVEGFTLTPEFSSEVYEYNINIPEERNDITSLKIEAVPDKDEYKVEIEGNEEIIDGENLITIIVKSADGEKQATYKIKVNKQAKTEEVIANFTEEPPQTIEEDTPENNKARWMIISFTALVAIAGIIFAIIEYEYSKKHKQEIEEEMPFASIGFETKGEKKQGILDDNSYFEDSKKSKGRHF